MFENTEMNIIRNQQFCHNTLTLKYWLESHSTARRNFLAEFPSYISLKMTITILILSNTLNYIKLNYFPS